MDQPIKIEPLRWFERLLDICMVPLMYVLAGTIWEAPQRAHRWNNTRLTAADMRHLRYLDMANFEGIQEAGRRYLFSFPIFHIPILGGWRTYVVLEPVESVETWHVGWITADHIGVSRVPITSRRVRMLLGPYDVSFFGVTVDSNGATRQLIIRHFGYGTIGNRDPYSHELLL